VRDLSNEQKHILLRQLVTGNASGEVNVEKQSAFVSSSVIVCCSACFSSTASHFSFNRSSLLNQLAANFLNSIQGDPTELIPTPRNKMTSAQQHSIFDSPHTQPIKSPKFDAEQDDSTGNGAASPIRAQKEVLPETPQSNNSPSLKVTKQQTHPSNHYLTSVGIVETCGSEKLKCPFQNLSKSPSKSPLKSQNSPLKSVKSPKGLTNHEEPGKYENEYENNENNECAQNADENISENSFKNNSVDETNKKSKKRKSHTEHIPTPLSRPRRSLKPVERLSDIRPEYKPKQILEVKKGKGTPLGHIPNVQKRLEMTKSIAPEVKLLFKCCFPHWRGVPTKDITKIKIREFSGFVNKKEGELARERLENAELKVVKLVSGVLDLNYSGTKSQLIESIVQFLEDPKDFGGPFKAKGSRKRKSVEPNKTDFKKKNAKREKRGKQADEEHSDEEEDEEKEEDKEENDNEDSDNKPLKPKGNEQGEILENELREKIVSILQNVDLSTFTIKDVRKILAKDYSAERIEANRQRIKDLTKELVNTV